MSQVMASSTGRKPKKGKVTCVTCGLKRCLGRCQFEVVASPPKQRVERPPCR
jgi:hypothetical protein